MRMVSLISMAAGFLVIALNWSVPFRYYLSHKKAGSISLIPLIGGLMASAGMAMGAGGFSKWWWLPLVIDLGTAPIIVMTLLKRTSIKT